MNIYSLIFFYFCAILRNISQFKVYVNIPEMSRKILDLHYSPIWS